MIQGQASETTTQELKKALEEVAHYASIADQERNTYLLLLASIGEGVLVIDSSRKISIANRAAEKITGYSSEELIGARFDEVLQFIYTDKTPLQRAFWDQAFVKKASTVLPADISVVNKSGVPISIADVISPIIDTRTQEHKGIIVTFRDVREERMLEEARVGFISTASHQLRTPLTAIRWFTEMLLSGDAGSLNAEQKRFTDFIYASVERMINLVNFLLQLARVEAGRIKIEPRPVDLQSITRGVTLTQQSSIKEKSQTIEIHTTPDPFPPVSADYDILWQVVQNLLSNASRYSPDNSTISVAITQKDKEIEYSVKDRGIGIPKENRGKVFEKFFRAENAVRLVPEGSGLGLALVKFLVEGWGGKIWFESEEGKGTTFFFTFPLEGMKPKAGEVTLSV